MALEGDLGLFRLPDILQVIAQQSKTGILTVQGKSDILAVSFLRGEIVAADALNQSLDELLGDVLERRSILAAERFADLVERQRASGERLVDYLVASGSVGRDDLLEALNDLTYQLLVKVLRWREGQFKFYGGEEVAFEEGIRPLRVDEVLMRSLRERTIDSSPETSIPHGYITYRSVAEGRAVRVIPTRDDEAIELDPETTWITPDERTILDRLDGNTPADQIARESGFGESRTFYAIYRLLQAKLAVAASEDNGIKVAEPARRASVVRAAERRSELRVERSIVEPEEFARPAAASPLVSFLERCAPSLSLLVAAAIVFGLYLGPQTVLFAAAGTTESRVAYERLLRLERFGLIDRAARTFHLLEARYPVGIEELVLRGLLPAGSARMEGGAEIALHSEVDSYQVVVGGEAGEVPTRLHEGVFGDFLLDHRLLDEVDEGSRVPIVLID